VERIWKEAVMACLRYYPDIYLEGLRKISKKLYSVIILAEVSTRHLFFSCDLDLFLYGILQLSV
jgi:hypothetical protein